MKDLLSQCPICKNNTFEEYMECKDFMVSKENFHIVSCTNCHFKFTNPRPDQTSIANYYESEEYVSHKNKSNGLINSVYKIARLFTLKQKLALINKHSQEVGNLLDMGCGTGSFLNVCKKEGWKIDGIEPEKRARHQAEELVTQKIYKSLQEVPQKLKYDTITLWHVLEHVPDVQFTLEKLSSILKPKGTLVIAVPNFKSWDANHYKNFWAAYDLPRHFYHFHRKDIKSLTETYKLSVTNISPMKLDAYYVSLLSEKYKGSNNYFKAIYNGFRSNQWAKRNNNEYSSLIYILNKKD